MEFGRLLEAIINQSGSNQADIANRLGVSQALVSQVIHGKKAPLSADQIKQISKHLRLTVEQTRTLLSAAALERGVVPISGLRASQQRLVAELAHRKISEELEAQISELLNDEQPIAA